MATITYGEARFTNDVDIVADLEHRHVEAFCASFAAPEYYCSRIAVEDAIRQNFQFNVIRPASGLKIDFIIPDESDFNQSRLARARFLVLDDQGHGAKFASPEDVILKKLEYYAEGHSEKHLRDIRGVLLIQSDAIDQEYLDRWALELGVVDLLNQVREKPAD